MNRKLLFALLLLGLTVIVLLLNVGGDVRLSLGFNEWKLARALVYFGFTAVGVLIGLLLK